MIVSGIFNQLHFLLIWIGLLVIFGFPVSRFSRSWLLPWYSWLNLMLSLLVLVNLRYFWFYPISLLPLLTLLWLGLEIILITLFLNKHPSAPPSLSVSRSLVGLYFGLFSLLSLPHFNLSTGTFFVPGYDVNHDAMNVLTAIKANLIDLTPLNTINYAYADQVRTYYPQGTVYQPILVSQLLGVTDFYPFYSRLILANLLMLIWPAAYVLKLFKVSDRWLLLGVFLSVFNFYTLNIFHTAVMASTVLLPVCVYGLAIIYAHVIGKISYSHLVIQLLITSAVGVFIYTYVILGYLLTALGTAFLLTKKMPLLAVIACLVVLTNPHLGSVTYGYLSRQFTSVNSQESILKGAKGNTMGFIHPLESLSVWWSHRNYLNPTPKFGNEFLGGGLVLITLLLWIKALRHQSTKKSLLIFGFPLLVFYVLSRFIFVSPYQNVKVLQLVAVLWPLLAVTAVYHYRHSISLVLLVVMFTSGCIGYTSTSPPFVESQLFLRSLEPKLCSSPASLLVINRDEWANYAFLTCPNISLYLDRGEINQRLTSFVKLNRLSRITDPCQPHSLKLTEPPALADRYLVDTCIDYVPPHQTKTILNQDYILYE